MLPTGSDEPHAVVVLPAGVAVRDAAPAEARWLAQGRLVTARPGDEPLVAVLGALGREPPGAGLAALRKWGQSGVRPDGWLCAADPVYLEARLDHLCLFALTDVTAAELAGLMKELQARLGADRDYRFSSIAECGYLESSEPLATAGVSAITAHGAPPDRFLPGGSAAARHDLLQSELQMCLYELDLNRRREESDRLPVNALWFWGGGTAATDRAGALPPLFSDDPLASGYWLAAGARRAAWPGELRRCVAAAGGSFVAIVPQQVAPGPGYLETVRDELRRGSITRATLLFQDGTRAELRRRDRFRFWRRRPSPAGDGDR